jgi:2-oxoglutarate ferredoxin oxidoreductase subunit alpha
MAERDFISIVLAGAAGQGIQTVEKIVTGLVKKQGFSVFSIKEYMSRVRGGVNSTQIIVSSQNLGGFRKRTDLAVLFTPESYEHLQDRMDETTIVAADEKVAGDLPEHVVSLPMTEIAKSAGSRLYQNSVAVGLIAGVLGFKKEFVSQHIQQIFASKSEEIQNQNAAAAREGVDLAQKLNAPDTFQNLAPASKEFPLMMAGHDALGLGAIAGGCRFICSYPMSPGTGLLTTLAKYSHEFNIAVEQAEDEIAAVNMAAGAWYAGARTVVTTSGGGFALMTEGVSLAGIMELPLVINVSMRPGPATGLPTRTEQGDLNLALYAGHGEFPRIVYAPRDVAQGFDLAKEAMENADAWQVPVLLLTDQYFMDSIETLDAHLDTSGYTKNHIVETDKDYQRYTITDDGLSPRGIPGFGEGIVCCDSDEHTQEGYITEDMNTRIAMVEKRARKEDLYKDRLIAPELIQSTTGKKLIVSWGTNYHCIKQALAEYGGDDIDFLHFSCVYPLPSNLLSLLEGYEYTALIENNSTGQFARLIRGETGFAFDKNILQYNGMPFAVEDVVQKLENLTEEKK